MLSIVFDRVENHAVAAEIMRAASEHLCPDFADQIDAFLIVKGV